MPPWSLSPFLFPHPTSAPCSCVSVTWAPEQSWNSTRVPVPVLEARVLTSRCGPCSALRRPVVCLSSSCPASAARLCTDLLLLGGRPFCWIGAILVTSFSLKCLVKEPVSKRSPVPSPGLGPQPGKRVSMGPPFTAPCLGLSQPPSLPGSMGLPVPLLLSPSCLFLQILSSSLGSPGQVTWGK